MANLSPTEEDILYTIEKARIMQYTLDLDKLPQEIFMLKSADYIHHWNVKELTKFKSFKEKSYWCYKPLRQHGHIIMGAGDTCAPLYFMFKSTWNVYVIIMYDTTLETKNLLLEKYGHDLDLKRARLLRDCFHSTILNKERLYET